MARAVEAEQGLVTGTLLLTPIQHWFFEQNLPERHHWNQAAVLEVREQLDPTKLKAAIDQLMLHHDALRLRFVQQELNGEGVASWQQTNVEPDGTVPFTYIDLSHLPVAECSLALETKATELQTGFNLADGPLMQVAYFEWRDQEPARLLLIVHHLVIDGVSWRILLENLYLNLATVAARPKRTTATQNHIVSVLGAVLARLCPIRAVGGGIELLVEFC